MPIRNPEEPFSRITVQEAKEMIDTGNVQVIDARNPDEHAAGHVPGSLLMPHMSVPGRIGQIADDKDVLMICKSGYRSALACEFAAAGGRTRLFNVEGGHDAWAAAGLPMEM